MRFYHLISVLAAITGAVSGTPLSAQNKTLSSRNIPVPNEKGPLANLDGLHACYGKCMISEAHLHRDNMFEQSLDDWCAEYFYRKARTFYWMVEHLDVCVSKTCGWREYNAGGTAAWWRKVCPH
ncbi:hypothetical protein GE09DRAFT_1223951 [Coniochaeta sp. 2T2.1]|nr:hypothetical protein GE09DRAFT_1223951 [Coniochaeta sp. 2T2.1]